MQDSSAGTSLKSRTQVRVLVVDDSRTARSWLRHVLEKEGSMVVVGEADCAIQAAEQIEILKPDVITLDIDMPGQSGLGFLGDLMKQEPMRVVMISGYTSRGSTCAIEALTLGAVDCLLKPAKEPTEMEERHIRRRVRVAATARLPGGKAKKEARAARTSGPPLVSNHPILIGASTGGVSALETVLYQLEGVEAPIVIAQHMPERFLKSLATRLSDRLARRFAISQDGMMLEPDLAIFATGRGPSTVLKFERGHWYCLLKEPSAKSLYRPSVDDLFQSAARQMRVAPISAALLTGMGRDGARGMVELRRAGCFTVAQDEDTSTVFGMPKAAIELGGAEDVRPITEIGQSICAYMATHQSKDNRVQPEPTRGRLT